jgi:uncharacterized protein YdeI (YjbR/CyaY-like superfamily)
MKAVSDPNIYFESLDKWREEAILLREIVLNTGLTESIKWGAPCYTFNNENVVGIGVFKSYTGLWFFQGALLEDKAGYLINAQENKTKIMLQWRFNDIDTIRNAPIQEYIFESVENFRQGRKLKPTPVTTELMIPDLLADALKNNNEMSERWNALSNACKREYATYIAEAKRAETRISRLEKITPLILSGKGLNDQYNKQK